jgi:hypothetical protein
MPKELISHSEADAHGQCQKKHEYAHVQKLMPKTSSIALDRGNAGHLILETFLKAIKDGDVQEVAKNKALMNPELMQKYPMVAVGEAMGWCVYWIDNIWPTLGWKIVTVEEKFQIDVAEGLAYPLKVDAIVEINRSLVIVDHKFTYDAYSDTVMRIIPQMPRYAGALRKLGVQIEYGIYNFIRTRPLKDPAARFVQKKNPFNDHRIKQSIMELIQEMKAIQTFEQTPIEKRPIAIRVANKMNCDHCGFAELCAMELEGRDTKLMRINDFEENTYGYVDESEE